MSLEKYRDTIDKLLEELMLLNSNVGNYMKLLIYGSDSDELIKYHILSDLIAVFNKYVEARPEGSKEDIDKEKKIALILTKIQLLIYSEENKEMLETMFILNLEELTQSLNRMLYLTRSQQDISIYDSVLRRIDEMEKIHRQHNTQLADMIDGCNVSIIKEAWIQYNNMAIDKLNSYRKDITGLENERLREISNNERYV